MRAFFESLRLESSDHFFKDRSCCNNFLLFFRDFYSAQSDENERKGKSCHRWNLDASDGSSSNRGRIFFAFTFSRRRPLGMLLYETFDIKIVQSWIGCVIAASVIYFPLMYRNAKAAFESIDADLVYAGKTLGMSDVKIFWKIVFPTSGPGIAAGNSFDFARALGEYGATSMLAGNIPGKTGTISQKIAMVLQNGDYAMTGFWTGVILIIALFLIILTSIFSAKNKKYRKRW